MSCGYCGGLLVEGSGLTESVDRDFSRARIKSSFGRFVDRLRRNREANRLYCFGEERAREPIVGHRSLGIRTVELDRIEGSVGRCWDFDRTFMPACSCHGEKWRRIDRALREGKQLPPVKLYKLGELYFVEDGNHRVSVSRYRGLPMIEAKVTELLTNMPRSSRSAV